jgi:hypothetical protein
MKEGRVGKGIERGKKGRKSKGTREVGEEGGGGKEEET